MSNSNFKIIYTLKLHVALQQMGFQYQTEMRNPKYPMYNCWVYEATPAFLDALTRLTSGGQAHDK